MRVALLILTLFLQVVSAAADVLPGQSFTVTVTTFEAQPVSMQLPDGVELVRTDAEISGTLLTWQPSTSPRTLHLTVRALHAGDLVFRATSDGQSSSAMVRVCCMVSPRPRSSVYLPALYH